jgi:hypothetical protein
MDRLINISDKVVNFFFGKMPKKSRKMLEKYGDIPIVKIEVKRTPVQRIVIALLNVITGGNFSKAQALAGHDRLFHLRMVATLQNGIKMIVEKNQTVNVDVFNTSDDTEDTNTYPVISYRPKSLTLKTMLDKTIKTAGEPRFYNYDAFNQKPNTGGNCQLFIMDILHANNIINQGLKSFVLQHITKLIKELPAYTSWVSKLTTRMAAYLEKFFQSIRYKKGGKVKPIIKRRTRDYRLDGGKVEVNQPNGHEIQNRDTISALLVVGELVINRENVPLVEKFLRSQGIYLPNMERPKNWRSLINRDILKMLN